MLLVSWLFCNDVNLPAGIDMQAVSQLILHAFLQHLIQYIFSQPQIHFCNNQPDTTVLFNTFLQQVKCLIPM